MQSASTSRQRRADRRAARSSQNPRQRGAPAKRHQAWAGLSAADIMQRHPPGKVSPERALEMLLHLFNGQHTAKHKSVSHKTRNDRAVFLRKFLRELRSRAGFATLPDPRNLGGRHIQATVNLWREDKLAAATIQTYLSFLRGLAQWIGKPGMVLPPAAYGLLPSEYRRHEAAERDRSWSGCGIDIDQLVDEVCAYDRHVGAALRLIRCFGLRRKEAVMMRPHVCVVPFEATGLPLERRQAESYLWVRQGSKGGRPRFVPIATAAQQEALSYAKAVAGDADAHVSDPKRALKQNINHFSYVLRRFGLTLADKGATGHGLRHEVLIEIWRSATGTEPPVRGGERPSQAVADAARQEIAATAGHSRPRVAAAYIGAYGMAGSSEKQAIAPDDPTAAPLQASALVGGGIIGTHCDAGAAAS
jgi:integrase